MVRDEKGRCHHEKKPCNPIDGADSVFLRMDPRLHRRTDRDGRRMGAGQRGVYLRFPAGADQRDENHVNQYGRKRNGARARQPDQPCQEAGGRLLPHRRHAECGYPLLAGVARYRRGTHGVRPAGNGSFLQRAAFGRMDEHCRRAGSGRRIRHRAPELDGRAARERDPRGCAHRNHARTPAATRKNS